MNSSNPRISAVTAIGKNNRTIGHNNKLLWHIPEDLQRFKILTIGHPVIIGRRTFESILDTLGKPLPNRKNIVVTRDSNYSHSHKEVDIVHSLDEGIVLAKSYDQEEIFIGGGQQIYEQALPIIDRLYLTLIDSAKKGDTFFPPYENIFTKEIERVDKKINDIKFTWLILEK